MAGYSVFSISSPVDSQPTVRMSPEQKLWLCVLLQAIAEQDPRFVSVERGMRASRERELRSKEAREFCQSDDYYELCRLLKFDARRKQYPEKAAQALEMMTRQLGQITRFENCDDTKNCSSQ